LLESSPFDRLERHLSNPSAQHGIAADRFAREIVGILTLRPARSRQLNANPFGGSISPGVCKDAHLPSLRNADPHASTPRSVPANMVQ